MKMTPREREELAAIIREAMVNGYTKELMTKSLAQMQEDEETIEKLNIEVRGLKTSISQQNDRINRLSEDLAYERGDYDDDDDYDDYGDDDYDDY